MTDYLKANPNVKMEVQGYCDNKGTYKYNVKLSNERANAVRKYLVGKGIQGDRLTAKGYSFDNPVASNATAEGRALNRRVVFKPIHANRPQASGRQIAATTAQNQITRFWALEKTEF